MKSIALFILHIFNGTVATLAAAVFIRKLYLIFYLKASGHSTMPITMELQSFLPAIIAVGVLAGYITFSRIGEKSAMWIFFIPAGVLLVKILMFRSNMFDSGIAAGWRYLFGSVRCSSDNLYSVTYPAARCLTRFIYIGAVCASLAYSTGAALANMQVWPELNRRLRGSGKQHS